MAISQIVQNSLSDTISLGPKITSVQVANSTYVVKDDTAINIGGGYIVITGSGFQSNCSVIVDSNIACSVAFVSATQVRAELPAKPAGTYNLYLLNGDGGTAIRVNALQYSNTPTWVTSSPLTDQPEDTNVSIQLSATGANTYVLQTGSTLPDGLTLSANGLISGFVNTNVAIDTTYNFTVEAIDTENQETPKAFAVTIVVADPFFNRTVLLLDGDGTSGANNNVFRDSSNNNFAITRNGNTTQGTFTPHSPAGWSNYFDGSGDYLTIPDNAAFDYGSGDFTLECWFLPNATLDSVLLTAHTSGGDLGPCNIWFSSGVLQLYSSSNGSTFDVANGATIGTPTVGQWNHMAVSRQGNSIRCFLNGVLGSTTTSSATLMNSTGTFQIGARNGIQTFTGHISNFRVVKGTAVYTAAFTPSTSNLTAISGTSLLTCQSNRFKDSSTNNFTVTPNGNPKVTPFSPFAPTAAYSAATHGGSGYFDGTGDYLTLDGGTPLTFGTGDFTIECWTYRTVASQRYLFDFRPSGSEPSVPWVIVDSDGTQRFGIGGSTLLTSSTTVPLFTWAHVAFVKNSGTVKIYIDGVERGSQASATSLSVGSNRPVIGAQGSSTGDNAFPGYISSFRAVKGTAVYTSAFTPPTAPLTAIANTSLLTNFTNAGILDYTAKSVIETVGDARINTAVTKYGTGSISFDGNGDIIKIPSEASSGLYSFGTGDFTIEFWIRFNVVNTEMSIMDFRSAAATIQIAIYMKNTGILGFYVNQADRIVAGSAFSANQWYHVAIARYQANTKMFIDGTQTGSTYADTNSYTNGAGRPWMGALSDGTGTLYLNALVDDVRITKGVARYTSNFTPPTSAHRKS